jgi:hypothetical protein
MLVMQAVLWSRICFKLVHNEAKHTPEVPTDHTHEQSEESNQQEAILTACCYGSTKN